MKETTIVLLGINWHVNYVFSDCFTTGAVIMATTPIYKTAFTALLIGRRSKKLVNYDRRVRCADMETTVQWFE